MNTKREINALDMSELRVECAKAMGWRRTMYQSPSQIPAGVPFWCKADVFAQAEQLPAYDSDPAAALTLVDRLAEDGWTVEINNCMAGKWCCEFTRIKDRKRSDYHAIEPTLPLAICRAFLAIPLATN